MASFLLVTTIVRYAKQDQNTGFVWLIDFDQKEVLMKAPIPESAYRAKDPNPRGGLRGARGVSVYGDMLVIANTERLLTFDFSSMLVKEMTHPWMGGIHDILAEADGIWVTCTYSDLLLKIDWNGKLIAEWEWRLDKNLTAELGFNNLHSVDRNLNYRDPNSLRNGVCNIIHLNSVTRAPEGLLLCFGRILSSTSYKKHKIESVFGKTMLDLGLRRLANKSIFHAIERFHVPFVKGKFNGSSSALVLLRKDGSTKLLKRLFGANIPNHNLIHGRNSLVYNDTNRSKVIRTSLNVNIPDCSITIPGQSSFLRGLAQLDEDTFFVGSQAPAAIYKVDFKSGLILSSCELDGVVKESVYAICIINPRFCDAFTLLAREAWWRHGFSCIDRT